MLQNDLVVKQIQLNKTNTCYACAFRIFTVAFSTYVQSVSDHKLHNNTSSQHLQLHTSETLKPTRSCSTASKTKKNTHIQMSLCLIHTLKSYNLRLARSETTKIYIVKTLLSHHSLILRWHRSTL